MNREQFGQKIAQKRISMDESQEVFGLRFGVTQQAVANWEAGESLPGKRILHEICALVDVPFEEAAVLRKPKKLGLVVEDQGPNFSAAPEFRDSIRVPLISWVQAGEWQAVADPFEPGAAAEWLDTRLATHPSSFALTVFGDSMEPEFLDGEVIIIDPGLDPLNGSYVVAKNGDDATFKQLIIDGSQVFLKPINPRYPIRDMTGIEFRIVGVVVEKRKRYR